VENSDSVDVPDKAFSLAWRSLTGTPCSVSFSLSVMPGRKHNNVLSTKETSTWPDTNLEPICQKNIASKQTTYAPGLESNSAETEKQLALLIIDLDLDDVFF
jgi:hypothetical protein